MGRLTTLRSKRRPTRTSKHMKNSTTRSARILLSLMPAIAASVGCGGPPAPTAGTDRVAVPNVTPVIPPAAAAPAVAPAHAAANGLDRTVLPIAEPSYPHATE